MLVPAPAAAASTSEAKPQKIVIPPGWGNGKGYYAPTFYMAFKKAGLKRWTALVDVRGPGLAAAVHGTCTLVLACAHDARRLTQCIATICAESRPEEVLQ